MSRGRLNIATCLVTGSIETVISVSVLCPPFCSSAPMSRMLSRSLPSHGGIDTLGTGVPIGDGSGVADSVGSALGSTVADGSGVSSGWSHSPVASAPMKMQPPVRASSAMTS